jgi:DNA polymerase-4
MRRILHVDMDAFFASVEQRDDPTLRGRPVVVGGSPDSRGVVAAASYEARAFGVRSAMSCAKAARLCPDAVFVRPDLARYKAVSDQLRAILLDYTDLVEPLSLDEAYLDVTAPKIDLGSATAVAREIRRRVHDELRLTASAGVGPSKLVAKIASDVHKPDGLTVVPPHRVLAFLHPLPVERLWGVGPATASRLHDLGLKTIGDVAAQDPIDLGRRLGSLGPWLWRLARGDDPREVTPHRERKSSGAEETFPEDVRDVDRLRDVLRGQCEEVGAALSRHGVRARTVTIKVRYDDFTTVTRAETLPDPTDDPRRFAEVAVDLLARTEAGARAVRLVGVSLSGLVGADGVVQLILPFAG